MDYSLLARRGVVVLALGKSGQPPGLGVNLYQHIPAHDHFCWLVSRILVNATFLYNGANPGGIMSIHQRATARCTFDLPIEMRRHLKIVCAEDNEPMNAFVARAIEREFDAREERLDEAAVDQAQKEIAEHGTIPISEMKKRLGL